VVADLGDGLEPARVVDREEFGEVGWFDIEARGVERVGGGEVPDRGFVGGGGAVEAFEDPFEDTAVFAAARFALMTLLNAQHVICQQPVMRRWTARKLTTILLYVVSQRDVMFFTS
jgi:hypothetical protein